MPTMDELMTMIPDDISTEDVDAAVALLLGLLKKMFPKMCANEVLK